MLYFEKSQPAPSCLVHEKEKVSGDYKCGDVLNRLKEDFKNKCYICESKEPQSINVEHFTPHKNNKELKFSWNNLFLSCAHCNNVKLAKYINILNCTIKKDCVETGLRYFFDPLPFKKVEIEALNSDEKTSNTRELLLAVYNGTTDMKRLESSNLRKSLLKEIRVFQDMLVAYFEDTNDAEDLEYYRRKIKGHLNKASAFTSFKRWIIRDNEGLLNEFGQYLEES